MSYGIHIFTRDLRIIDNNALNHLSSMTGKIIPIFIINEVQVDNDNKFKSSNAIQFMYDSLKDLNQNIKDASPDKLKLLYLHGSIIDNIKYICKYNYLINYSG